MSGMELQAGYVVGPYQLVRQAGSGGMAVVWQAYHARLDRYVAIKFLSPQFSSDTAYLDRFLREARAISRLDHPHILTLYDFGEQDGWTYMVSPFIAGGTLAARTHRGPWTTQAALDVLDPLASALDYAHAEGIVHRDVKPSNILFTERGRLVLTDFGIARLVGAATVLSQTGLVIGTPTYMSPEQARGEEAGPASDIYSLGVVAYEILTGRPPFVTESPLAALRAHIDDAPPAPTRINPALSDAVEYSLLRALAKSPDARFPTAAAFVAALRTPSAWQSATHQRFGGRAGPTVERPPWDPTAGPERPNVPFQPRSRPSAGRATTGGISRRQAVLAFGAMALSGVGFGLTIFAVRNQIPTVDVSAALVAPLKPNPAPESPPTQESPNAPAIPQPLSTVTVPTPTVAPSLRTAPGGQLVVVMRTEGDANDLFLLTLGGTTRRLTGPTSGRPWSWAPAIAPDGQRVAFNHGTPGGSDIEVMHLDGSNRYVAAASSDTSKWGSPWWRHDGALTFHGLHDGKDGIFQTSGSGVPSLVTLGGGVAEPLLPTWARVPGPLAFAGKDERDWRIWVLTHDGSARAVSPPNSDAYAPSWSPDGQRIAFQGGGAAIMTVNPDGAGRHYRLPYDRNSWAHAPSWSPDGKWIAFVGGTDQHGRTSHGDLWIMPADDGAPIRITSSGAVYDWRPVWVG